MEVRCDRKPATLFIVSKKVHDSLWRKVFSSILVEFGIRMKILRLITTCLNKTYTEVRTCIHFLFRMA
jgi:hypothetical protein